MYKYLNVFILILILSLIFILCSYSFTVQQQNEYLQLIDDVNFNFNKPVNKLFNLDFKYVIESDLCANRSKLLAVLIVTSYFGNVEVRSAMRRAFSNEELSKFNIVRVFLLGVAENDHYTKQNAIVNEAQRFGDILQGNFQEAYRNLTYKHLMGLKWASDNCLQAKYVVKMDDDIVLHVEKLASYLKSTNLPKNNLLAGYVLKGMVPIREKANKWYVTYNEYSKNYYPTFLSGWFYITNPITCKKLVYLSKKQKYFWIDDTFVTGVLANMLQVKHVNISRVFTLHPEFLRCCMNDVSKYNYKCDFIVGPNGGDTNLFYTFNAVMKQCSNELCTKRSKSIDDTCVSERKINLGRGESNIELFKL